jgi:2-polyprenyl-6-methoxyphenol hydroxylase-like FAD-dependent oxidoreductase
VLAANGVRVLERLPGGVGEQLHKHGWTIDHVVARTISGQAIHSYTPSELSRSSSGLGGGKGYPNLAIHGAKLHDALSSTLPSSVQVTFNASLSRISRSKDAEAAQPSSDSSGSKQEKKSASAPLQLHFDESDKNGVDADLVIGADGPHSAVRAAIPHLSGLTPQSLGGQYIRGLCRITSGGVLQDAEGKVLQPDHELHEVWGKGEKFSWYWLDEQTIAWLGVTQPGRQQSQMFRSFAQPIPDLMVQSEQDSIHTYPITSLAPHVKPYSSDSRLVLIGEASHATTQELWQSASLDCEDAIMLAILLSGLDRKVALELYGGLRYSRTHFVATSAASETAQALQQGGLMTALRDVASSMMPPSVVREQMKTLLGYDAIREAKAVVPGAQI